MKKMEDYFTGEPLESDVGTLSDPALDYQVHRETVNERVLNTVIKYLAAYLKVAYKDIPAMRRHIEALIRQKQEVRVHKDPLIELQYGPDHAGEVSDYFPVKCLADIRRTAAVFKEVAFNDRFQTNGRFTGIDWGSGTGILTLAMAIAARRKGVLERLSVGVDLRERAVRNSRRVLKDVLGADEARVICENILRSDILEQLIKSHPLNFWVSETISKTTPPIDLTRRDFGFSTRDIMYRDKYEACDDPFPEFLGKTLNAHPGFLGDVRQGRAAMFPNIANRSYYPHRERSVLTLRTGPASPLSLKDIGREFDSYEGLDERWRRW